MPRARRSNDASSPRRPPKRPRGDPSEARSSTSVLKLRGRTSKRERRSETALADDFVEIISKKSEVLAATSLDVLAKTNAKANHTEEYDEFEGLVVRRGASFDLEIGTNTPYDSKKHKVTVWFAYGKNPDIVKGTHFALEVKSEASHVKGKWGASLVKSDEKNITVKILSPATAKVGQYKVFVETETQGGEDGDDADVSKKSFEDKIILIFNPWSPDDVVYMADEAQRHEYVEEEEGALWGGSSRHTTYWHWTFGQFDKVVLEAALFLLDKGGLADSGRANPVMITRMLSKMSNDFEDEGVLTGKWEEPWPKDCTLPWDWNGSVPILEKYMESGGKPVEFGQCWVFSGIITSLCRSLGIPTRSVSNFESAHDFEANMTVDYYLDKNGEIDKDLSDQVWNFHVWNESWFRRPGLPAGNDGWQAFDATPQELSDGVHQCGPAPVSGVKEGNLYLPHDATFIFSEVNGDRIFWEREGRNWAVVRKDTRSVGDQLLTKSVGSYEPENLIRNYKYPEGSPQERAVVRKVMCEDDREDLQEAYARDLDVKVDLPDKQLVHGEPIPVKVTVANTSDEEHEVTGKIALYSNLYTGTKAAQLKSRTYKETIAAGESKETVYMVEPDEYATKIRVHQVFVAFAHLQISSYRKFIAFDEEMLLPPQLIIKAPARAEMNEDFEVEVKFNNTTSFRLSSGVFTFEGRGIKTLKETFRGTIKPGDEISHTTTLRVSRAGNRKIIVGFKAERFEGLTGSAEIYISYPA